MNHIQTMLLQGEPATVFSMETADREDVELIVKLDQLELRAKPGDTIVFDFSGLTALDGRTTGLPMSFVRSLARKGCRAFVILNDVARDYLVKRGIYHIFVEVYKEELAPIMELAS